MISFTDPLFLLFAVLVWSGTIVWTYVSTRLLARRKVPVTTEPGVRRMTSSATSQILEDMCGLDSVVGLLLWMIAGPVLLGSGQPAFTLEGFFGMAVGATVLATIGVGVGLRAEHVEVPESERKYSADYRW